MVLLMLVLIIVQHGSIVILMTHVSDHVKMYVDLQIMQCSFISWILMFQKYQK